MKDLIEGGGVKIPEGWTFVEAKNDRVSYASPDDTPIERLVLISPRGQEVVIVRHNHDDSDIVLRVGRDAQVTDLGGVNGYIKRNS